MTDEWTARWQEDLANLMDDLVNPPSEQGEDWRQHPIATRDDPPPWEDE